MPLTCTYGKPARKNEMQVCLMVISNASQGNALKHKGKGKTALFAHGRVLAHPGGDQSIGRRRRERSPTLYLSI